MNAILFTAAFLSAWPTLSSWPALPPATATPDLSYEGFVIEHPRAKRLDERLTLLIVYGGNSKAACESVAGQLVGKGYEVVLSDARLPKNLPMLERFSVDVTELPYMILYRGHEALQVSHGRDWTPEYLAQWIECVRLGRPWPYATEAKDAKQEAMQPLDREVLRYRWSMPTCGMAWCGVHGGGWVLERVAIPQPQLNTDPAKTSCPTGQCPGGT